MAFIRGAYGRLRSTFLPHTEFPLTRAIDTIDCRISIVRIYCSLHITNISSITRTFIFQFSAFTLRSISNTKFFLRPTPHHKNLYPRCSPLINTL